MNHKIRNSIILTMVVFILLAAAFCFWFYSQPFSGSKISIAKALPFPAAFVDGHPIFARELVRRLSLAEQYSTSNKQKTSTDIILGQLIDEKNTQIIAQKYGVSVGSKQLDDELEKIKNQSPKNFTALLKSYGISESTFKLEILKPDILRTNLLSWFNAQRSINSTQYALADSLKQQITSASSSTSTFATLVKNYSQDPGSKTMQGDMGFVEINNMLTELKAPLDSAKPGDVIILPSRYGIHIFQIIAADRNGPNNSPRLEIKQIFLQAGDFSSWFNGEINNIKVKRLLK